MNDQNDKSRSKEKEMHMLLQESMRGFPSIARYPALADIGLRGRTNQSSLTHSMLLKLLMLTHSFFPHSGAKDFFPAPSSIPLTKPGGGSDQQGRSSSPGQLEPPPPSCSKPGPRFQVCIGMPPVPMQAVPGPTGAAVAPARAIPPVSPDRGGGGLRSGDYLWVSWESD